MAARSSKEKVQSLLNPRNVVILGATDKPGNWAQRVWRNVHRYKFPGKAYPMNPGRDTVWDTRCYKTFTELPEPPDHVVVLVPARHVPKALAEAAAAGARSATILSSGFGEAPGEEGADLEKKLKAVIRETGLAVSGPNCLGNMSAQASLMTMTDDRPQRIAGGPVAIVGQSGGLAMAIKRTLEERGIDSDALITSGNESGLTTADYIDYFAEDPKIKVIVSYLESVRDPAGFLAALRKARAAGKPVVVHKLGASKAGQAAAMAHTGALAGSIEAFEAVAGEAGAIRVRNLDEIIEAVEYIVHTPLPKSSRAAAVTLSGGMRGLLLDAASNHGLSFNPLSAATANKLSEILTVGSSVGNPLDAGFAALTVPNVLFKSIDVLLADPDIDLVLVQEEIPRGPGSERKEESLRAVNEMAAKAKKPIAYISMISHSSTDYSRDFRTTVRNLPFLQEIDKSIRVLSAIARYRGAGGTAGPVKRQEPSAAAKQALAEIGKVKGAALDEVRSKALLKAYGIDGPQEEIAKTAEQAVEIAKRIGFPVVAKLVSAELLHKSDIGGVLLGLETPEAVNEAFHSIERAVAAQPGKPRLDGVLIAEQVSGGLELVIGASRDPEMGPVILFGSGGVEVELIHDVAITAPPLDEKKALALIERTKAGTLIKGYRGKPALAQDAAVKALIGLSNLMLDAGDKIQSIDINPFLLDGKRGVALDALVVLNSQPQD